MPVRMLPTLGQTGWPEHLALAREVLDGAYQRPCWICKRKGNCGHREPRVERALILAARRGERKKSE